MDLSGTKIETIAQNIPFARSLDWSENKLRRTVYLRAIDAENDVYVYNFETKTETRIRKPGFQLKASISKDGSRIAYLTGTRVHVMKLDGSDDRLLPINAKQAYETCWWGDDGTTPFFTGRNLTGDNGDEQNLGVFFYSFTLDKALRVFGPGAGNTQTQCGDFTSQGKKTLLVSNSKLFIFDKNGVRQDITPAGLPSLSGAHFSKDGLWIAFTTSSPTQVCLIKPDGTGFKRIGPSSDSVGVVCLGWTPEGKIAFLRPTPNVKESVRKAQIDAYSLNFEFRLGNETFGLGVDKPTDPLVGATKLEPTGFDGGWITNYGAMELRQKGTSVTGKYVYKDGLVDGLVSGNVMRFTWLHQEDKLGGSGKFKLSESGNGFIGMWNSGSDPDAAGTLWGGVRKGLFPTGVQGGNFAGNWETTSGKMILTQKGDLVRGTYEDQAKGGHIDGIVRGNTLRLTWVQTVNGSCGSALFKLSPTGNSFTGTWSSTDTPDTNAGSWTGTRSGKDTPVQAGAKNPWVIEPDSGALGRNGIVRTKWHEKTSSTYQAIYVYLPGKHESDEYHEFFKSEHRVLEGRYDMRINGMWLLDVPVTAGHATRILLGALHSTADYANQLAIHDSKDQLVMKIQGGQIIALPIGEYHLKVGTRTFRVEVKENEVTEF